MTGLNSKQELNDDFSGLKYILTSSIRSKLLLTIYERPKNLTDLRDELDKPSASILHGLKELENKNLIRKVNKQYQLTSNGILLTVNMIKLIENWSAVNNSKIFWNNHDLSDIPDDLLKNIYLLKDAEYVNSTTNDLSSAFNTYVKLISNAEQLTMILPIYSENHFKKIMKILKQKKLELLELIISEDLLRSMQRNQLLNERILKNEKVNVRKIKKNLKVFLTYSENFMTLSLFFNDGHYDDSQILVAKNKNAIKWAQLYTTYY